jgi:predicted small secreted protein
VLAWQLQLLSCINRESSSFQPFNQKGKTMKKIVSVLSLLAFAFGLTACNTMRGLGQDVERGGEKVQGAATNQQNK